MEANDGLQWSQTCTIYPPAEYDKAAHEYLEQFYPDALKNPMSVPIEEIVKAGLGLDVQYVCLSEELDIYGITIFTDEAVEVYNPCEGYTTLSHLKQKQS